MLPIICKLPAASVPDLFEIESQSPHPSWSESMFAQEFSIEASCVLGARSAGQIVGFLVFRTLLDEAHVLNLGVRKEFRRHGVARELFMEAARMMNETAIEWATLEVRRSNFAAQELYKALGFFEVGVRENYYIIEPEDAVVMSLNIREFIDRIGDGVSAVSLRSTSPLRN